MHWPQTTVVRMVLTGNELDVKPSSRSSANLLLPFGRFSDHQECASRGEGLLEAGAIRSAKLASSAPWSHPVFQAREIDCLKKGGCCHPAIHQPQHSCPISSAGKLLLTLSLFSELCGCSCCGDEARVPFAHAAKVEVPPLAIRNTSDVVARCNAVSLHEKG